MSEFLKNELLSLKRIHNQNFKDLIKKDDPIPVRSVGIVGVTEWNISDYHHWLRHKEAQFTPKPEELDERGNAPGSALCQELGDIADVLEQYAKELGWNLEEKEITLEKQNKYTTTGNVICSVCNGAGEWPGMNSYVRCSSCKGRGEVKGTVPLVSHRKSMVDSNTEITLLSDWKTEEEYHYDGESWTVLAWKGGHNYYMKDISPDEVPEIVVQYAMDKELV
ncbi:hypothetical protein GF420_15640 [candidate division GN15 bacterium]|nr:hypothetical protein [candidate division GN15 bacterium]